MIEPAEIQRFEGGLSQLKVLVIGDLMLDRYHFGRVNRISPEAPVPIVDVDRTDNRPGGAANVALNIRSMGAQVALCGVIGHDDNGRILQRCLTAADFDISLVLETEGRPTTTKTRIIGNNQQVLRVDYEVRDAIPEALQAQFLEAIAGRLQEFDAVVFEDYDKGMLGEGLIQAVIGMAQQAGIPTVVDPKFRNFWSYAGATLFKPNLKELNEALGLRLHKSDLAGITRAVADLRKRMPIQDALVTLSENGMVAINEANAFTHIAAHFRKITDVSGAGDTVIALMALALAMGLGLDRAAFIANLAGGLVCEEVGVVPVNKARLLAELAAHTQAN